MEIFDFVECSNRTRSPRELFELLLRATRSEGFDQVGKQRAEIVQADEGQCLRPELPVGGGDHKDRERRQKKKREEQEERWSGEAKAGKHIGA